jgi:hypothetical protein
MSSGIPAIEKFTKKQKNRLSSLKKDELIIEKKNREKQQIYFIELVQRFSAKKNESLRDELLKEMKKVKEQLNKTVHPQGKERKQIYKTLIKINAIDVVLQSKIILEKNDPQKIRFIKKVLHQVHAFFKVIENLNLELNLPNIFASR